jgi:hypothetical protein
LSHPFATGASIRVLEKSGFVAVLEEEHDDPETDAYRLG